MKKRISLLFAAFALACGEAPSSDAAAPQAAPVAQVPPGAVARVVFLDQAKGCPCSRKRIDDGWSRLQAALDYKESVPVERIHVDTEVEKSRACTTMKQALVAPAIYFLDRDGRMLDMVQGEVTEATLRKQLARGR